MDKKEQELQEQIEQDRIKNYNKWLTNHGFNEHKTTYIYFPSDSYDIKDQLKEAGFRFNNILFWHAPYIIKGYEDKIISIKLEDVAETCAWGTCNYYPDAKTKVEVAMKQARPHRKNPSEWIGEIGDKIKGIKVKLLMIRMFEGYYGYSQIVKFETPEGNILKWFTTKDLSDYEIGETLIISGTIKDLIEDKYEDNEKVTILTRCRLQ